MLSNVLDTTKINNTSFIGNKSSKRRFYFLLSYRYNSHNKNAKKAIKIEPATNDYT